MAISTPAAVRAYQRALRAQRATLDRLLDRRALLGMKRYFDQAQDQLERMLGRLAKDAHKAAITPLQVQQMLIQVRAAQRLVAQRMALSLRPVLREAQVEGVDQTAETVDRVEKDSTGALVTLALTDAAVKGSVVEQKAARLTKLNDASWSRFGEVLVDGMSTAAAISLALEDTPIEAIVRMRAAAENNWWQAQRIIQTEMAYAYNQAQADAIQKVAQTFPGLGKRWCELVDDTTGLPMDDRVGNDSIALHGQVAEYAGVFVMPPDPSVHPSFWNKTWESSPNRPHDRSITMPWRAEWGVPGWRWLNNSRVPVNR